MPAEEKPLLRLKHFKLKEFDCPCCLENFMNYEFLERVDAFREVFGSPLTVNSGYRCPKHNTDVGGKSKSLHMLGFAADISMLHMMPHQRDKLLRLALEKFKGVGIGKNFIHVDGRVDVARWVY